MNIVGGLKKAKKACDSSCGLEKASCFVRSKVQLFRQFILLLFLTANFLYIQ